MSVLVHTGEALPMDETMAPLAAPPTPPHSGALFALNPGNFILLGGDVFFFMCGLLFLFCNKGWFLCL